MLVWQQGWGLNEEVIDDDDKVQLSDSEGTGY